MKKIVCLALTTVLLLALCFALASCGECKEHEWDYSNGTTVAATCTENGKYVYACTKCGETKDVAADPNMPEDAVLIATGHKKNAASGKVTTEPTCTEVGEKTFDCMICGAEGVVTEEVKASGHKFARTLSTESGKHFYACTVEGCTARNGEEDCDYETVSVDATKHNEVCIVCEEAKADSEVAHTFGDPVTTPATCTKAGAETKTCSACGYKAVTDLPMLSHEYDETAYGSNDEQHWIPCKFCQSAKDGTRADHTFGDEETTQPTAGSCAPGKVAKTCSGCGKEVILSYIPSNTAHTFAFDATASDMQAGGIQAGTLVYACSVCEFSYAIDALGVKNFDDNMPAGQVWVTVSDSESLKLSYTDGNYSLIGPVNANTIAKDNAAINLCPASENVTLADNNVLYLSLDVSAPEAGYHETGWNLDIKFGDKWTGGQLKLECDKDGNMKFANTSVGVATPGKVTNIVIEYIVNGTSIASRIWINGVLKASATATGVTASNFADATTYMNVTVGKSDAHVSLDRGLILDNIAYADELPAYLADQTK